MGTISIHLRKGDEYVWRYARAYAKEHNMALSELLVKAVLEYCANSPHLSDAEKSQLRHEANC